MAEIKLSKTELRLQQNRLTQLQKYLPTLQLKKAMLQVEVNDARLEISALHDVFMQLRTAMDQYSGLLGDRKAFEVGEAAQVSLVKKRYENIAGVEVPYFEGVEFEPFSYDLFDSPPWVDSVVVSLRSAAEVNVKKDVVQEKKTALEGELRDVAIRVNLFEKILIPRALKNIKKIKVFLGDQQLAAVSQAKVAKTKIEEHKSFKAMKDLDKGTGYAH